MNNITEKIWRKRKILEKSVWHTNACTHAVTKLLWPMFIGAQFIIFTTCLVCTYRSVIMFSAGLLVNMGFMAFGFASMDTHLCFDLCLLISTHTWMFVASLICVWYLWSSVFLLVLTKKHGKLCVIILLVLTKFSLHYFWTSSCGNSVMNIL